MNMRLLLFNALFALLCALSSVGVLADSNDMLDSTTVAKPLTILVVCEEGTRSHVVPYFEMLKILHNRGHRIVFASFNDSLKFASDHPFVETRSIGSESLFEKNKTALAMFMNTPVGYKSMIKAFSLLGDAIAHEYPNRTRALTHLYADLKPNLVLCDFFADACIDSAVMTGTTLGMLGSLGFKGFMAEWFLPSIMNPVSTKKWMSDPWLRLSTTVDMIWHVGISGWRMEQSKKAHKKNVWGRVPVSDYTALFSNNLYLTHTFWGLEPARRLPPNVVAVGPLFGPLEIDTSKHQKVVNLVERIADTRQQLIYVAFGSAAAGFEKIAERLFEGLNGVLTRFSNVEVLWACRDVFCDRVVESKIDPAARARVHIRKWVPQRYVLESGVVKAFVSHGGISSVYESLYAGVPIIVVPLFADQPINAIHIEERGVGINLRDKLAFTGGDVEHAIETVLSDQRARNGTVGLATTFSLKKVNDMKVTARLSSEAGLLYGANIVEMVATTGSSNFLVPEDVKVAYWQRFGISNFGATCTASAAALLGGILVWRNMSLKTKIH